MRSNVVSETSTVVLGFTGTQAGMTDMQRRELRAYVEELCNKFRAVEFHHGDCVGADEEAHYLLLNLVSRMVVHPGPETWKRAHCRGGECRQSKGFRERNQDIVDTCHVLIAAPRSLKEELRSGTWMTVRMARRAKKPIVILNRAPLDLVRERSLL